jgi:hypothetical protein
VRIELIAIAAGLAAAAGPGLCGEGDVKDLAEKFKGTPVAFVKVEADAGVQAGNRKDANLGRSGILEVKDYDDTPDWGWVLQRVFLRFNLAGLKAEDVKAAYLAVYGNLGDGNRPVEVEVRPLADKDDGWDESKITWNNQPKPAAEKPLATLTFTFGNTPTRGAEGRWYLTADIGDYIRSEIAKGNSVASFVLTTKIREEACLFTKEHEKGSELSPRLAVVKGK